MLKDPKSLDISSYLIPAHDLIPNTSILGDPLLIYHECFFEKPSASEIEKHLRKVNVVSPQWRYSMYSTSHFHSTTHEVLSICSGSAKLLFGGDENPQRVELRVTHGDVVIIPAGVAHRLLEDIDGAFEMVGSYPVGGKSWDMCHGRKGEEDKVANIKDLPVLRKDPIYGDEGPLVRRWASSDLN